MIETTGAIGPPPGTTSNPAQATATPPTPNRRRRKPRSRPKPPPPSACRLPSLIIALALLIILSTSALAQSSTTLGRWMQQQPASVLRNVGCDLPLPYATRCWRHVVRSGRIVETWHYRQESGRIVMWRKSAH